LIIRKIDINSILPIIIKIIILNLEVVNKFAKSIFCIPNISEVVVLVIVRIDSLKDFSKFILSIIKTPDKINKLIKNEINIKKEILILSLVILYSGLNKFLFTTLLGLTSFIISAAVIFKRM
tara:strand:+ start:77 stop:442 length:366 start_codon:yes stop_codon:yes gene_type:complete